MDNNRDSDTDSIHSIVTDRGEDIYIYPDDFNSDNEAPEDKPGQVDKIVKNHVIKKIIKVYRFSLFSLELVLLKFLKMII